MFVFLWSLNESEIRRVLDREKEGRGGVLRQSAPNDADWSIETSASYLDNIAQMKLSYTDMFYVSMCNKRIQL